MKLSISVSGTPCRDGTTTTCGAELQLDELNSDAESKLSQAVQRCIQIVSGHTASRPSDDAPPHNRERSNETGLRLATAKQVAAIEGIARRKRFDLGHFLQDRFGVASASELSIKQASSMIDELKQTQEAA